MAYCVNHYGRITYAALIGADGQSLPVCAPCLAAVIERRATLRAMGRTVVTLRLRLLDGPGWAVLRDVVTAADSCGIALDYRR